MGKCAFLPQYLLFYLKTAEILVRDCLDEEEFILEEGHLTQAVTWAIYFQPTFINSSFDFKNIRAKPADFNQLASHDLFWIYPFLYRSETYTGILQIGPETYERANAICGNIPSAKLPLKPAIMPQPHLLIPY